MQRYDSSSAVKLKRQFTGSNSFGNHLDLMADGIIPKTIKKYFWSFKRILGKKATTTAIVRNFPGHQHIWGWTWAVLGQWSYAQHAITCLILNYWQSWSHLLCALVVVLIRNLFAVTSSCDSAGAAWCYCNDGLYVQVVCWLCPLRCDCSTEDDQCSDRFSMCRSQMSCCLPAPLFLPMISEQMITHCRCFMSFSFYLYR